MLLHTAHYRTCSLNLGFSIYLPVFLCGIFYMLYIVCLYRCMYVCYMLIKDQSINKKHLKNVGPIRHCEPFYISIHQVSLLSHAACASMSTTTTTTTTRDRGDRYGSMEWAQSINQSINVSR